jgi:hypothetical protein
VLNIITFKMKAKIIANVAQFISPANKLRCLGEAHAPVFGALREPGSELMLN